MRMLYGGVEKSVQSVARIFLSEKIYGKKLLAVIKDRARKWLKIRRSSSFSSQKKI